MRYFVICHIHFNRVIVFYGGIFSIKSFAVHAWILKHEVKTWRRVQLQNELAIILLVTFHSSHIFVC